MIGSAHLTFLQRAGQSPYNPIFEFDYDIKGQQIHMVVTSVTGHMMNYAYPPEYKSWERVDPVTLFEAPVYKEIAEVQYYNWGRHLKCDYTLVYC